MVDSTSKIVTANTDAPDCTRMDQPVRAAEKWYSEILALIKLR